MTTHAPSPKIKAVNLAGWLVAEGSITPSLFDEIPNKDFLDGTQLQLKSVTTGKYLAAENGGGSAIVANRPAASGWETFKIWRVDADHFQFVVFDRHFIGLGDGVAAVATATVPGPSETFQIVRNPDQPDRVRIKAANGLYWRANSETSVTAEAPGTGDWGDGDSSVFLLTTFGVMRGEYQVTNGYGRFLANLVMKDHWNTFITEDDFRDIAEGGLNAVRIPVGWWIASDPAPPAPFVGGSLAALDGAFAWAEKYKLGVIVDLHAAPGAQNPDEHGGSRDGYQSWGEAYIPQTVAVIDFLTARYGKSSALLGMELMNEPRAPGVTLSALQDYYRAGYAAVRKYTSTAYVIMSNRLGTWNPTELLSFAGSFPLAVLDVHFTNLDKFGSEFNGSSAQHSVEYVYLTMPRQLREVIVANGPLVFVGQWNAKLYVPDASEFQYMRYAAAQLQVFKVATFGWAYWTWKNVENVQSLRWMIRFSYINLSV